MVARLRYRSHRWPTIPKHVMQSQQFTRHKVCMPSIYANASLPHAGYACANCNDVCINRPWQVATMHLTTPSALQHMSVLHQRHKHAALHLLLVT